MSVRVCERIYTSVSKNKIIIQKKILIELDVVNSFRCSAMILKNLKNFNEKKSIERFNQLIDFLFLLCVEIVCACVENHVEKCGLHLLSVLCLLIIYVDHVLSLTIQGFL